MPRIVICADSQPLTEKLANSLKPLNIPIIFAQNYQQILSLLDSDEFLILLIEQNFPQRDTEEEKLLSYLSRLPMYRRRELMVILIGENLQSGNRLTAYSLNVDLVINTSDVENIATFFKRAYSEYQARFKLFREFLKSQTSLS